MSAMVVQANARCLPLPDQSVNLIVTSPPYFSLRSYRDQGSHFTNQIGSEPTPQAFLESLWVVLKECWRVLRDDGSCWVNLGDKRAGSGGHNNSGLGSKRLQTEETEVVEHRATRRNAPDRYNQAAFGQAKSKMLLPHRFAIGCEDGLADPCIRDHEHVGSHPAYLPKERCQGQGWILRQDLVWRKLNGLPESVNDRTRDSHEYWFHLTKQGRYFSSLDEIREPHAPQSLARAGRRYDAGDKFSLSSPNTLDPNQFCNPKGKLPSSVWAIPSEPLVVPKGVKEREGLPDHYAAFPTELPRRIILAWSPASVCVACGEGRRPLRGTYCELCRAFRPNNAKSCPECGHRRNWKEGRIQREAMGSNGWSSPGHGTPRHPGNHKNRSESVGVACGCPAQAELAPTRPSVVLDPFSGTATTAGVASALGRTGIGVDLSHDYCRLGAWFIRDGRRFEKVIRKTHGERQGDLFASS